MGAINFTWLAVWVLGPDWLCHKLEVCDFFQAIRWSHRAWGKGGGCAGRCPDFASCTLAFDLQMRKITNNQDETVGIFVQEEVWLKNSQSEGGVTGRERVREQEQSVEGNGPLRRPVVIMWGRNGAVPEWGRGATGWWRSYFCVSGGCLLSLRVCRRGLQDLLKARLSSCWK